jgi:hypothetical protein
MRPFLTLPIVLLWILPLGAFSEPDGFNGLRWGDGTTRLRSRGTVRFCEEVRPSQRERGDGRCVEEFRFEEASPPFLVEAHYFTREPVGLRWVLVKLEARHFDAMKRWLVERHGPAGFARSFTVQVQDNSLAGFLDREIRKQDPKAPSRPAPTVENEVLEWRGGKTSVVLLRYGTVTHSLAYLGMTAEVDRELERLRRDGLTIPRADR